MSTRPVPARLRRISLPFPAVAWGRIAVGALYVVAALALVRFALRVHSFQPDEFIYVDQGRQLADRFPEALWDTVLFKYGIERLNPVVQAVCDGLFGTATALTVHKVVNAAAFALVVFPVYKITRRLQAPRPAALVAAALAVAIPWTALSTSFLNEPIAYPCFWAAIAGCLYAATRPGWRGDALGLAGVALAGLARTNLAVLGAVLVIAVLLSELRFGATRRPVALLRRHVPLVAAVVLATAWLAHAGTGSLGGVYPVSLTPDLGQLASKSSSFLAVLGMGLLLVPFAIGGGWVIRQLARPTDRTAFAFAVIALSSFAVLFFSLYHGDIEERYVFYLAPFALIAMVAALIRRDVAPPYVAVAGAGIAAVVAAQTLRTVDEPYGTFAYPGQTLWGRVAVGQASVRLPHFLAAHAETTLLVGLPLAAVVVAWLVRRSPKLAARTTIVVLGAQLVVGVTVGWWALNRYVYRAGDPAGAPFSQRAWIDRALDGDGPLDGDGKATLVVQPGIVEEIGVGIDGAMFNRHFGDPNGLSAPAILAAANRRTGRVTLGLLSDYVVELAASYQSIGLIGRRIGEGAYLPGDPILVHAASPHRLAWWISGPDTDGWLPKGKKARVRTYGGRCVAFTAYAGPPGSAHLRLRFADGSVRRATVPAAPGNLPVTTHVPGTTVIQATGDGSLPPDRKVTMRIGNVRDLACSG
jgi:hypothetical protein